MDAQLRALCQVCGIPDLLNLTGNRPTQLFITYQGLGDIKDSLMLRIKDVPYVIKDHHLVPAEAAQLGAVQQRKMQVLIWWAKDRQRHGLPVVAAEWKQAALRNGVHQINSDAKDKEVERPGKVETGYKWPTWDIK